ncbi:MAG: hypothetical protein ACFCD0_15590 [Gemmataceae bacterium]
MPEQLIPPEECPCESQQESVPGLTLETMLRRLPRTLRQLRFHGIGKRPVRIAEQRDLEDLIRAMLPLFCNEWREHCRNPEYSPMPRTDYLLLDIDLALTSKYVARGGLQNELAHQIRCDASYYEQEDLCSELVVFIYDPQGQLRTPEILESICGLPNSDVVIRCVVGK